jgi:hypothetical protein
MTPWPMTNDVGRRGQSTTSPFSNASRSSGTDLAGLLAARRLPDRYEELWRGRIDRMTGLVAEPKEMDR